jgi:hypothetical protein
MALLNRKTEEEKAAAAAFRKEQQELWETVKVQRTEAKQVTKQQREQERKEANHQAAIEVAKESFFDSQPGKARVAFEAGHELFQCSIDVMNEHLKLTTNPVDILNAVCREGWELVNGSFVFHHEQSLSRAKYLSAGQPISVGTTFGYYLFRRAEQNRRPIENRWVDQTDEAESLLES